MLDGSRNWIQANTRHNMKNNEKWEMEHCTAYSVFYGSTEKKWISSIWRKFCFHTIQSYIQSWKGLPFQEILNVVLFPVEHAPIQASLSERERYHTNHPFQTKITITAQLDEGNQWSLQLSVQYYEKSNQPMAICSGQFGRRAEADCGDGIANRLMRVALMVSIPWVSSQWNKRQWSVLKSQ